MSNSSDSPTSSAVNETLPSQAQEIPNELDPIEIEGDENEILSPLEKGEVVILDDPIPVDSEIGYLAPSFKAQLNTGSEPVTIDPADGTVRLIGFFAHWCPHCQREVPRIKMVRRKWSPYRNRDLGCLNRRT